MSAFITRFAPSPTGLLHLGHAFSALTAFNAARDANGRFILRIEDIDQTRCKKTFEDAIAQDLNWLGLTWAAPVRRQSDHMGEYTRALDKLRGAGVVYRCFKTRKETSAEIARAPHLSPDGPQGPHYVGEPLAAMEERALLAAGKGFAWRLSIARAKAYLGARFDGLTFIEEGAGPNGERGVVKAMPEIFGDAVIARKDNGASYHLACVHDDALEGITHVIRGVDLYHASHLHVLIQALLNLPTPAYRHHPLITDENGKRYAKRDKSVTLQALREAGMSADELRKNIGAHSGG